MTKPALVRSAEPRPIRVGRYVLTGRIGRGGMGMVYRASDHALEREVALKTLTGESGLDGERRKRFEIEAKAAARLQHPNIVIVYELGEERGVPFIAMELLPGADLEAVLRSAEPLSLAEKLDVLVQVCRGLAYAHERGIVHRDIKPSNIRLLDDGSVKIMDFGIAKIGGTHLTKTGMMVGTVHYMSPEQVRGQPLDGRSDVFSTGVILYEALSGHRPFAGESATQVLYKIVNEEPAPLSLDSVGPVGPRLVAVLTRAIAKDPDARYPTAAAFGDDLLSVLQELQRAAEPLPAAAFAALAEARRQQREGRLDAAAEGLRTLVAGYPEYVEARRLLRAVVREQRRATEPAGPVTAGYPELEATFQATATRQTGIEDATPTVLEEPAPETVVRPGAGVSAERPVGGARRTRPTPLQLAVAGGALAVVLLSMFFLLLARARPAATPVQLEVRSMPSGANVLVDGRDTGLVTNGVLRLEPPVPEQVVLTFRKAGHKDETRSVRPATSREAITVALETLQAVTLVKTEPAGATLTVDGQRVEGVTPLQLALAPGVEHRIVAALDGHLQQEVRVARDESPAGLELQLPKLAPPGTVAVSSSYPLEVLWRGKPLGRKATSPHVSLPGGRQVLLLVAQEVFLRAEISANVPSGGEVSVAAPELGKLVARANPDNCQVFVDGSFVDYPPILERPLVVGRHAVSFRWPDGRRDEQVVEVTPGGLAFAFGRRKE